MKKFLFVFITIILYSLLYSFTQHTENNNNPFPENFDEDMGLNLQNSTFWDFRTENDNPNVTANSGINDGSIKVLELVFPGGEPIASPPYGANVETEDLYLYGTYKARLKAASCQSNEGVVSAFFTYWNEGVDLDGDGMNDNSEIDFEILCAAPNLVYMAVWTDYEKVGDKEYFYKTTRAVDLTTGQIWQTPEGKEDTYELEDVGYYLPQTISDFNASENYYEYVFKWTDEFVRFSIIEDDGNDIELWKFDGSIPSHEAHVMFNVWHTNNWTPENHPHPATDPPLDDAYVKVDWVEYITLITCPDLVPDGEIDIFDLVMVASRFGLKEGDPRWNPNVDCNQDGEIDIFDLVAVAIHFGESYPTSKNNGKLKSQF